MEMPEGWKRLKEIATDKLNSYFEVPSREINAALDLMKEMAEALGDMVEACHKGYGRDIQKMDRALKKFKDWK